MNSVGCLRFAFGCLVFLALLWPSLIIAGVILMKVENPRENQLQEMANAQDSFIRTSAVMSGTTGGILGEGVSLTQEFEHSPAPGTSIKSVYFRSSGTIRIRENVGPNRGSFTTEFMYKNQKFLVTSPSINLNRRARSDVSCSAEYSSVCGTKQCCTDLQMLSRCQKTFAQSEDVRFVTNNRICGLGDTCGSCEYTNYVSSVCIIIRWLNVVGWTRDTRYGSCIYPFSSDMQEYAPRNDGTMIFLRAVDDPWIVLERITDGTAVLEGTQEISRSNGRGLLLSGVLVFIVFLSLLCLVHLCHVSLCDFVALRRALGLPIPEGSKTMQDHEEELLALPTKGGKMSGASARDRGKKKSERSSRRRAEDPEDLSSLL